MSLVSVSPEAARALMNEGAVLVDIRGADEYARERIPGACNVPTDRLSPSAVSAQGAQAVIFHCGSGMRTQASAQRLEECADCQAYVLEGGLDAWKKAGLPVTVDAKQPLPLQRQVMIVAGGMAALGWLLGTVVSPRFHLLSGFVGMGLMVAGLTGFCGMARLLKKMPWNRKLAA